MWIALPTGSPVLESLWDLYTFFWMLAPLLTGVIQAARGRNPWLWALLAVALPIPAFIAACALDDVRSYAGPVGRMWWKRGEI